jgi:integrase
MTTILRFPGREAVSTASPKNNATPNRHQRRALPYAVVGARLDTGEGLPTLIRTDTWVPQSLALRWAVFARRYEVAEGTLRSELDALRYLYAWGDRFLAAGLEARLEHGAELTALEVERLKAYLRDPDQLVSPLSLAQRKVRIAPIAAPPISVSSTEGARAKVALAFLKWASVPAMRNSVGAPPSNVSEYHAMLEGVLQPLAKYAGKGGVRIPPLSADAERRIAALIAPKMDRDGRWLRPIQFHKDNPFYRTNRLRNWLMWVTARDSGLRLGELLTLRTQSSSAHVDDVFCVKVQRNPDAADDPRAKRPQVKTLSRAVSAGPRVHSALRAYITAPREQGGRKRGGAYLFTSTQSRPLGISAASGVISVLAKLVNEEVSWHSLRHCWAEELADTLLNSAAQEFDAATDPDSESANGWVTDKLRAVGGWSLESKMPFYYAQNAIRKAANKSLNVLQERRAAEIVRLQLQTQFLNSLEEDDL